MIEFIQDYTTKSLPPEVFKDGQRLTRSTESELYLVRLGVAGYVHEGNLVDQDYAPIVRKTVAVEIVGTADRRFAIGARGGEALGLVEPQRASTGPRAGVLIDALGTSADPSLHAVEVEQLRSDLAASVQQLDDHRDETTSQIGELTADLTAAQGARETALADLATAKDDKAKLETDLASARADLGAALDDKAALTTDRDAARADLATANARIGELEAAAAASASSASSASAAKSAKPN